MNDESMYIDGTYSENNPEFNDGESKRKADSLVRLIKDSPAELSDINSVLDYGCGGGGLITELCDKLPLVNRAMGIDLNHEAIDYAISNGRESDILRFKSGSLDDVDDEYDLISVVHVLEHIKDWDNFLLSIKEKADYVYFSVPIEASVWMTFRKNVLLNQYERYGHVHFFNEPYLMYYLQKTGFKVVSSGYSDEFLAFSGVMSNLIKLPRLLVGAFSKSTACNFFGGYCFQVLCRT